MFDAGYSREFVDTVMGVGSLLAAVTLWLLPFKEEKAAAV
jgi:hypothetical protein